MKHLEHQAAPPPLSDAEEELKMVKQSEVSLVSFSAISNAIKVNSEKRVSKNEVLWNGILSVEFQWNNIQNREILSNIAFTEP